MTRQTPEDTKVIEHSNALAVMLMGALPPLAGSAISFLLAVSMVWAAVSLACGRFEFRLTPADKLLASLFTLFAVVVLVTGIAGQNRDTLAGASYWLLPFLGLWFLLPRLRASPGLDYIGLFARGASIGCVAALAFAALELSLLGHRRPEGGTGNAIVFGTMCLCLTVVAGIGTRRGNRQWSHIAFTVVAGLSAVVLSLSRGVILVIPVVVLCLTVRWRSHRRFIGTRGWGLITLLAGTAVLALAFSASVQGRWLATIIEVDRLLADEHSASVGERLRLWNAAWQAFVESPLWGHGIQNRMNALVPYLASDGLTVRGFTHVHNAYLSAAVDGGIPAVTALLALLATPVVVAWRAPRDRDYRRRLFLAVSLALCYALVGATQILFKHDILDSFYIFACAVIAASIPDRTNA